MLTTPMKQNLLTIQMATSIRDKLTRRRKTDIVSAKAHDESYGGVRSFDSIVRVVCW